MSLADVTQWSAEIRRRPGVVFRMTYGKAMVVCQTINEFTFMVLFDSVQLWPIGKTWQWSQCSFPDTLEVVE